MSVVSGEVLHRISRDELIHVLESIHGVKDIFLDGSLMKPLDRIAGISVLRDHGVDKVYALSHEAPADPHKHRVYMVRSGVANTRLVCELVSAQINRRSDTDTAQYHVVYVAKVLHACRVLLESEGLHGRLAVHSLPLDFVSVDCDLASLELPDFLRHVFVDGLTWPATAVARATWRLRALLGATRCHVYAVGHVAQQVVDLMSLFDDSGGSVAGGGGGACEVDHLLVMDRSVDWPAVLLTQLTYAGLLHETMPVKCGVVEVPDGSGGSGGGVCKLALHCRDEVYAELRDMHISGALPALSARAKQLQCQHANRRNLSLGDMKEFIQDEMRTKQAQHRSLAAHISLSEAMMSSSSCGTGRRNVDAHHLCVEHSLVRTACVGSDADSVVDLDECRRYVEQWMAVQRSAPTALRLLCLYAAAAAPLSHRRYQQLAAQFVASYGHRHLATLQRLAALGMLTPTAAPTSAAVAAVQRVTQPKAGVALTARRLKLMPSVTSADSVSGGGALLTPPPPDPSYVYGGSYVPVCCRLLEAAVGRATSGGGDWSNVQAAFKQLTAAGACSHQCPPAGDETKSSATMGCPVRAVCVLVLGGCTMAEVAAMQATARSLNCRLLTLTTSVITGDSLMHELASLA